VTRKINRKYLNSAKAGRQWSKACCVIEPPMQGKNRQIMGRPPAKTRQCSCALGINREILNLHSSLQITSPDPEKSTGKPYLSIKQGKLQREFSSRADNAPFFYTRFLMSRLSFWIDKV
jgi:hypothetical protein